MVEKVVRSLQDLEDALALADREGGCRIRIGSRVAALIPSDSPSDDEANAFLTNSAVVERLNRSARSLEEGRGIPHKDVVQRLGLKKP